MLLPEIPKQWMSSIPCFRLQLKLQMRIRISAVNFVKATLVALPGVPSEEEYAELKRRRKQNAVKKIAEEKEAARRAKEKYEDKISRSSNNILSPTTRAEQAALGLASTIRGTLAESVFSEHLRPS